MEERPHIPSARGFSAGDDFISGREIRRILKSLGFEYLGHISTVSETLDVVEGQEPSFVILAGRTEGTDALELARRIQETRSTPVILLSESPIANEDLDRFGGVVINLTKHPEPRELDRAITTVLTRFNDARNIAKLQTELLAKKAELEDALERIEQLEGILSICSWCKKIKTGDDQWVPVETFIEGRSSAIFSHGMCPECYARMKKDYDEST